MKFTCVLFLKNLINHWSGKDEVSYKRVERNLHHFSNSQQFDKHHVTILFLRVFHKVVPKTHTYTNHSNFMLCGCRHIKNCFSQRSLFFIKCYAQLSSVNRFGVEWVAVGCFPWGSKQLSGFDYRTNSWEQSNIIPAPQEAVSWYKIILPGSYWLLIRLKSLCGLVWLF